MNNAKTQRSAEVSKPPAEIYSGFVIVRLRAGLPQTNDATLIDYAKRSKLDGLADLLGKYKPTTWRNVRSLTPDQILALEQQATEEYAPRYSLTSYWRMDMRNRPESIAEVIAGLTKLAEVDHVYRELIVTDPLVGANNKHSAKQGYLNGARHGINARWAWTQPNSNGAGVRLFDLERAWLLNHEDLVAKAPTLNYGDNRNGVNGFKGDHGASVLGIIVAENNGVGVIGVAYGVTSVGLVSHYDAATNTELHVADAIAAAIPLMSKGDVLLLEVQRGSMVPTEIDHNDFDAIRLAVAHGITVVEAAGNGDADLDVTLTRADDSGAIMVGAATSAKPHNRWVLGPGVASCFGSRINCYAWGENIVTCGGGDLDNGGGNPNKAYTGGFGGTSGAAAIVAGVAVVLQGMYKARNLGARLPPARMRQVLGANGTPQGRTVPGHIGVMPDLKKAATALGLRAI